MMNIDCIRGTNERELKQLEKYGHIAVRDSVQRAREIEWLLSEHAALLARAEEAEAECAELREDLAAADDDIDAAWREVATLEARMLALVKCEEVGGKSEERRVKGEEGRVPTEGTDSADGEGE